MTMFRFWTSENSFRCEPLENVSFHVFRQDNKITIELTVKRFSYRGIYTDTYIANLYIDDEWQNASLKRLTEFFDTALETKDSIVEMPNVTFLPAT